ncbi:MAG: hypothetical protein LIR50_21800 [Bacillota bacterium]|nr:hypothetical protein [Bacillota bacterium]
MAKVTKTTVDADLRARVFDTLLNVGVDEALEENPFVKINDRQYGIILTDLNGVERYVRIGAIVAEERDDMTARDLMAKEIAEYEDKQAKKEEKAKAKAEKIAKDEEKRKAAKADEDE